MMLLHLAVMKSCTQSLCVHHSKGNDDFYPPGLSNSSYPNPWPPQRFLSKSKISPKVLFQSLWFITRLLSKPLEGNLFVNLLGEATAGAWGTQGTHWGWTCFVLFVFEAFCTSVLRCILNVLNRLTENEEWMMHELTEKEIMAHSIMKKGTCICTEAMEFQKLWRTCGWTGLGLNCRNLYFLFTHFLPSSLPQPPKDHPWIAEVEFHDPLAAVGWRKQASWPYYFWFETALNNNEEPRTLSSHYLGSCWWAPKFNHIAEKIWTKFLASRLI